MSNHNDQVSPQRGQYQGVWQIFCYNWPWFVGSAALKVGALAAVLLLPLPALLQVLLLGGATLAVAGAVVSLAAAHWIYDRSEIYRFTWVKRCLPAPPASWVNIHSGLDETSAALARLYPGSKRLVLDIYNPETMTEPAIKRARLRNPSPIPAVAAKVQALPLAPAASDCVFLIFAAHEVRCPREREELFAQLAKALVPGGRVVLVEHLRDLANAAAFGPGYFHFLPRQEWLRVSSLAGFSLVSEEKVTPFVSIFTFEK